MVEVLINNKPYCPFLEKEPIIVDSWQIKKNGFPIAGCFEVSTNITEPSILELICKE
jgi:hypothetical protein